MTATLAPLTEILDGLSADGRQIGFWWRDDDAVAPTAELDRLLTLATETGMPLAIAAIPALAQPALARRLETEPNVCVLPHGWRHANHAAPGSKSSEYGPERPLSARLAEVERGISVNRQLFGSQAVPLFVPPWNRLSDDLASDLARLDLGGLSAFGTPATPPAGVGRLDTHLDPVDWRRGRRPVAVATLAVALGRAVGGGTVVGMLSHHLAMNDEVWSLAEAIVRLFSRHPAVVCRDVRDLVAHGCNDMGTKAALAHPSLRQRRRARAT